MSMRFLSKLIILFALICQLPSIYGSAATLNDLLDDIKLYKSVGDGTRFIHSGDLFEHSMWVYYASLELLDKKSIYAKFLKLSKTEKNDFSLAALLHDVGKAGRKDLFDRTHQKLYYNVHKNQQKIVTKIEFTPDNQEHPLIGFEYVAKPFLNAKSNFKSRPYMLSSGSAFDFDKLFKELGISDEERKLIAILVGIHYEFGNFRSGRINCQGFLDKIQTLVDAVSYNQGRITKKLLHLSMLIQVADVKGLAPVEYCPKTALIPNPQKIKITHEKECEVPNPFMEFGYEQTSSVFKPYPYLKMQEMLELFDKNQPKPKPADFLCITSMVPAT